MNIKKPNSFARCGNDYVAPLTTIDQIVKPSGERYTDKEFELMSNVENVMFSENSAGKNLLRPTLQTTTVNGVTCTNNGDGTYTLNGTATDLTKFYLNTPNLNGTYKLLGCPKGGDYYNGYTLIQYNSSWTPMAEGGTGLIHEYNGTEKDLIIHIRSGTVCDNLVFKPMITDDLSATYDDFEPYVKSLRQLTNSALNVDLLWTNASPRSEFAEQNLFMDLSKYKAIVVEVCEYAGSGDVRYDNKYSGIFFKGIGGAIATYYYEGGIYSLSFVRRFYAIDDRIWISNSSNYDSVNNLGAIPQRIWGLR